MKYSPCMSLVPSFVASLYQYGTTANSTSQKSKLRSLELPLLSIVIDVYKTIYIYLFFSPAPFNNSPNRRLGKGLFSKRFQLVTCGCMGAGISIIDGPMLSTLHGRHGCVRSNDDSVAECSGHWEVARRNDSVDSCPAWPRLAGQLAGWF